MERDERMKIKRKNRRNFLAISLLLISFFVIQAVYIFPADAQNVSTTSDKPGILILTNNDVVPGNFVLKQASGEIENLLDIDIYNFNRGRLVPKDIKFSDYHAIFVYEEGSTGLALRNLKESIERAKAKTKLVVLGGLTEGNINLNDHPWIEQYFINRSQENLKRLMVYLGIKFCGLKAEIEEPVIFPSKAIYHPDAEQLFSNLEKYLRWYKETGSKNHKYNPSKPTIGILFYKCTYLRGDLKVIDALIRTVEEEKGCNVIPAYWETADYGLEDIFIKDKKSPLDALITLVGYMRTKQVAEFELLDVPVILGIRLFHPFMTPEEWISYAPGVPSDSISGIAQSEVYGIIEPVVVGVRAGEEKALIEPIESQIEFIVDRALGYAKLRHKDNKDKKIAVHYYSEGCGKANLGTEMEFYLDAQASIVNLLRAMKDAGYNTGDEQPIPDVEKLSKLMAEQGSNVGKWAKGELKKRVKDGSVILIPEEIYLEWFNELPEDKREEAIERWGKPPGNIMVYKDESGKKYIIIPRIQFGNVVLTPFPDLTLLQNTSLLNVAEAICPSHYTIAHFMWLKKEFNADAIVSIWSRFCGIKGQQAGMAKYGWKGLLAKDMLNIRPWPVHYIGAHVHKRRGGHLMIDHLSPPMSASGLYGDLANLQQDMSLYVQAGEGALKAKYKQKIIKQAKTLDIGNALGVNLDKVKDFKPLFEELNSYLEEQKKEYMHYGLHILGRPPQGEAMIATINSMLGREFKEHIAKINSSEGLAESLLAEVLINHINPEEGQKKVLCAVSKEITEDLTLALKYGRELEECRREIPRVLAGLDGRYIPPGPAGDIIKRPEVIPTGRNPYAFDNKLIPTQEAWELGKQMAEELLEQHYKKHNKHPEKIGFHLWKSETFRHHGVVESEILYLMGIKPVWDLNKNVEGVELIPLSEVKRPRIDVVVTCSGSYKDTLPDKLKLIDRAVRLAAEAPEQKADNYVRRNSTHNFQWLKENTGYSDSEIKDLAMARVFSQEVLGRTNKIGDAISAGNTWEKKSEIANIYFNTVGFIYGEKIWGRHEKGLFKNVLKGIEANVFSSSSSVVGMADQGVPSYFGAMGLAAEVATGKAPEMYITNLRDSDEAKVETLEKFLDREIKSRYFNPRWIKGMMKHGYAGARNMEEFTEHLWQWDVTVDKSITENTWNELNDVYIKDKYDLRLREFFDKNNPYALQSMISTMLEAREKGYWHPTREVLQNLVKVFAKSIAKHGIACSYGTCAEPSLHKDVSKLLSAMPDVKPELIKNYQENVDKATVKLEEVKGYEMKEVEEKKEEKSSTPKVALAAIVIVLLIMVVVGRGLWKGMRRQQ